MKREPGERQSALRQTGIGREGIDQEPLRSRAARPARREGIDQEPLRGRIARSARRQEAGPPPRIRARGDAVIARLRGQLRSRDALRQAMLLQAILGRPKGL